MRARWAFGEARVSESGGREGAWGPAEAVGRVGWRRSPGLLGRDGGALKYLRAMIARRAYGFHSAPALISMLFLCCGGIELDPALPSPLQT